MSPGTNHTDVLDAAEHLPVGAALVIYDFEWEEYERLLEALAERGHLRVSYDQGRLEILSPSSLHEEFARQVDHFVLAFCEARGVEQLRCLGQTTWKKKSLARGLEPDACFYTKNAELIRGKRTVSLESDPPPDIAAEIDLSSNSLRKLSIYAALGIPEVWRYNRDTFHFYELGGDKYFEIQESRILPGLTAQMLGEAFQEAANGNLMTAVKSFRERIRMLKQ